MTVRICLPARELNVMYRMELSLLVAIVVVTVAIVSSEVRADEIKEPKDLEIHHTFKPEQCNRKAEVTDLVTLHYKGTLANGHVFDSSHERGEPLTFQLGIGQVILGWDKGLLGVCVGEKRRLVVPPHLGYGEAKHDQIPPKSTLVFDVVVEKIEKGPKPENVFATIDADGDRRLSRKEVSAFVRHQIEDAKNHGDPATISDPDHAQMVDEIFMHEDKDRDDYISYDEFSGPKHDHQEL